jgi:NagD protein
MYQIALESIRGRPEYTLVVGDQMQTDIAAGIKAGCLTGLVLSGVADETSVENFPFKPTFVAQDLKQLINSI